MSYELSGVLVAIGCSLFYLIGRAHVEEHLRRRMAIVQQERDQLALRCNELTKELVSYRIKNGGSALAESTGVARTKPRTSPCQNHAYELGA